VSAIQIPEERVKAMAKRRAIQRGEGVAGAVRWGGAPQTFIGAREGDRTVEEEATMALTCVCQRRRGEERKVR